MKKILSVALVLAMGLSSFAQDWQPISQHVTGTDFQNGSTISSDAILSSGKAMVIDYSATWCSWCWVMHTNGILEAIHHQLGDQIQVVWVEADPSTTNPAEITGSGSTQGDWTNGGTVPYPIINDHNFANLIGGANVITGYPTVVFVSPTGYWCDIYGNGSWQFGPYDSTEAVTKMTNLLANIPQSGEAPVISSYSIPASARVGETVPFSVNVVSVDDYTIEWSFDGGSPATSTDANVNVSWSTPGTYTVTVTATNDNGTDTKSGTISVMNYSEFFDFEQANAYGDWTLIDADGDGNNWMFDYLRGQGAAFGGSNGMMASASWTSTAGALTPDNWVFTPSIALPNDSNVKLVWKEKGQDASYAAEKYAVYVATAPNAESATLLSNYTATPNWKTRALSLESYKGQNVYIAYRHYGVTDMFILDIDEIGVTVDAVDAPVTGIENAGEVSMSIYPNPVSSVLSVAAEGMHEVSVLDLSGRVLLTSNESNINVSELAAGVYYVRVVTDGGVATQKFVKQ